MIRNRAQTGENGRQDPKNERQGLENLVLHITASSDNDLARSFVYLCVQARFPVRRPFNHAFPDTGKLLVNR